MTFVALLAFLAFMHVVEFVAVVTLGSIFFFFRKTFMTILALEFCMPFYQFEFGVLVVIKMHFFPNFRVVAGFTFWPEAAFMLVIIFMAGNAGHL